MCDDDCFENNVLIIPKNSQHTLKKEREGLTKKEKMFKHVFLSLY